MLHYAILIDGGFAKRKLGTPNKPAEASDFGRLIDWLGTVHVLANMRLHRVYYYDSHPLESIEFKPLGNLRVDFGQAPIVARSRTLLEELAKQDFMALRLGELVFERWEVSSRKLAQASAESLQIKAEDLQPRIRQKGVDMRIGMDIAALTLKKQVQTIVLITGDSDFIPAMKFARREGAQLFLCPLGQKVKPAMREHCDLLLDATKPASTLVPSPLSPDTH
jgi:uncharacterized LabA/DUF88 family protein